MLTVEQMKDLHELFREQYTHFYCDPEHHERDAFREFAKGLMTHTECDDVSQQYYSDLSGECDREGFYE